jgi:hypothetical protein
MTASDGGGRASGVARLVRRRVRITAVAGLLPAAAALALAPGPPTYDAQWWATLLPRFADLAPDVLAAGAAFVALITLLASLSLKGAAALKLLVLLMVGETAVAVARMVTGTSAGRCVIGPCAAPAGVVGSAAAVWVCVALTAAACWVTASQFRGARSPY